MNKNDIITLEITALTNEGSGVGRYGGMAVFVPFTAVGDVIEARVLKVLKSYAYAKIERIITASPDRTENNCPSFGKCGGCVFRHISYQAELAAKERFVRDAFERIGGLAPDFLPICGSECIDGYRNKLQMPLAKAPDGRILTGFYGERSHRLVPIDNCNLQPKIFSDITEFIKNQLKALKISVYNEERHEGVLRHIYLRKGHYSGEICVVFVVRRNSPELKKLSRKLAEQFPQITGIAANINPEKTNVILGEKEITLHGRPEIFDTMCGVSVEISPRSFYQVNTPAAENLYRQAGEFAEPDGKIILDMYCGAGTIGLSMASRAKKIIGVEIVPEAVENARKNAEISGFSNAEFICADASIAAKSLLERDITPDVVILDPPRKGCDRETLAACARMSPQRIVMISCNPSTAARDCKFLSDNGFLARKVKAFDLFPRTKHVECVVLMTRSEKQV